MASRRTMLLPSRDKDRQRVVGDAVVALRKRGLKVEKIGRRLWHVDGVHMGTTSMVEMAQQ